MSGMPASAKISEQRVGSPWNVRGRLRVDRIGVPVVDIATGKLRARAFRAQPIAGSMAGAAMRQPFDQVGAAIPFRTLPAVRLVGPAAKKPQVPAGDHNPPLE